MHHREIQSQETQLTYHFNYNSDFSGIVVISWQNNTEERVREVYVPFDVLAEFVGGAVLSARISALEDQTGREVLGLDG